MLTLHVGPDKALFHVHQDLLFDASPVFKAAFCGSFQEAFERSMPLADDDKDSVRRMISWLYTKRVECTVPDTEKTSHECYMQLARLNTLADKYDVYLLKNHIVDQIFTLSKPPSQIRPPHCLIVAYVFDNTTTESSFRKLLVAWYAYRIDFGFYDSDTVKDMLADASQEFAIDLVVALGLKMRHPDRKNPFTLPSSTFHETPPKRVDEKEASQTSK